MARDLRTDQHGDDDAAVGCWDTKYYYFNPRPTQLDPSIKTQIALPNFPSYVSGHSVFSGAADKCSLRTSFPRAQLLRGPNEGGGIVAVLWRNPLPVGHHVGVDHGKRIGEYTVRFAKADGAD